MFLLKGPMVVFHQAYKAVPSQAEVIRVAAMYGISLEEYGAELETLEAAKKKKDH